VYDPNVDYLSLYVLIFLSNKKLLSLYNDSLEERNNLLADQMMMLQDNHLGFLIKPTTFQARDIEDMLGNNGQANNNSRGIVELKDITQGFINLASSKQSSFNQQNLNQESVDINNAINTQSLGQEELK
jgi:hypothetical protein